MIGQLTWQKHHLPLLDHTMVWYEAGAGPTVIGLSGGPGDDHSYLRPVIERLAGQFRWVLYDQRGTGQSVLDCQDEETLHPDRFVDDLEALRVNLSEDRLRLVGHSWGANLALLYSTAYPDRVDRAALVGLGPLDGDLAAVAAANAMKPLSRAERDEHTRLGREMDQALAAGDAHAVATLHARRLVLFARGAFLSPQKAEQFVEEYLAAGAHRNLNVRVNRITGALYRTLPIWDRLDRVTARLLVLYGYQDFEPITQAYLLRERIPGTEICFLDRCGHVPWLEQPEKFYRALGEFLTGTE